MHNVGFLWNIVIEKIGLSEIFVYSFLLEKVARFFLRDEGTRGLFLADREDHIMSFLRDEGLD